MLRCFEHWFGPYPWYRDGYQLIEAPHLGMEHQSAVAYGNGYHNGYKGKDLSGTGWGLTWDFIIVHETAHEWFGNNITTADIADMWVHESFANYSESLYTECRFGHGRRGGLRHRHARTHPERRADRGDLRAERPRARGTCTPRAATCSIRSGTSSATTPGGPGSCAGSTPSSATGS